MKKNVLISGGAGFIGSKLAYLLVEKNYHVRILDNLSPQVHGFNAKAPLRLADAAEVIVADITDAVAVRAALADIDIVVHLAAETGPAQSLYEIERYTRANMQGTAVLLQEMISFRKEIQKLLIASSRAVYGEGKYRCSKCGTIAPKDRQLEHLLKGQWDHLCPICNDPLECMPTDEWTLPAPTSIYAVSKLAQEQMGLVFGHAYNIPTIALRYQNVYGAGQSLRNPYIGILAIFCARAISGLPIDIYEDGGMIRDFVHVDDAVQATILAIENSIEIDGVYNVGSGNKYTILEVAKKLVQIIDLNVKIQVTGEYRTGDIRHNYADLGRIKQNLGYVPRVDLDSGLRELFSWASQNPGISNLLESATSELKQFGLFSKANQ